MTHEDALLLVEMIRSLMVVVAVVGLAIFGALLALVSSINFRK